MEDTVVIIDQDTNARIIAEALLRTRGRHVLGVRTGAEACDLVRCEGAAVVVVTLPPPESSSLHLLGRLRGQLESFGPPTPRIVAVANHGKRGAGRRVLRMGADAVLHAPTLPSQLVATVERLMSRTLARRSQELGSLNALRD